MSYVSEPVDDLGFPTAAADSTHGVAVVGMACRLPGAPDPQAFWELLDSGRSALGPPPSGRFPEGHDPVPPGGYLPEVDRFDPEFFGISPAEAVTVDPQQRLVLELAWESLEDAGMLPRTLAGSRTGVFVGAMGNDYSTLVHQHGPETLTRHTLTGLGRGLMANRVSYLLDLRGPSLSIDSGQSSSLVAVHVALESLRNGESDLALVAGVNLNLAPDSTTVVQRFGALSPDGRCFTFDARANGYARGEGAVLLVLKPLHRARADGDTVHALLLGSAVNSDGAGSGLTVPDAAAQADLIRNALSRCGVSADDVQYVELHGTGTPVGDPIEAQALGAVLGGRPADRHVEVGSAKTNVGHLEGASGLVGLLKTVLAVRHRRLPASLNFEQANPAIDLAGLGLRVRTESGPWPRPDRTLLAGVSSFGVGGTNAHVVVAQAPSSGRAETPTEVPAPTEHPRALLWALSARTAAGVTAQAERLRRHLARHPGTDPVQVAQALATRRTAFEHRAVLLGSDRAELTDALATLARGEQSPQVIRGRILASTSSTSRTSAVFVFPGQGTQWPEMARQLLTESTVFAGQLDACAEALAPFTGWSLRDVLLGAAGAPALEDVDVVQPVLFSVMVCLAAVWRAQGVQPGAVIGHSQGEIAAAHVAGALDLDDAARVVALRSQAIRELLGPGVGAMASVPLPVDAVLARTSRYRGRIEVAAVNGPSMTVVSGAHDLVAELVEAYQAEDVRARRIPVDYASHSSQVESLADDLPRRLRGIRPRTGSVAFYSTMTGGRFDPAGLAPEYWYRNLRSTVEFDRAVRAAAQDGHQAFVEVSPHPVLTVGLAQILQDGAAVTGTLRRGQGGLRRFRASVAELHTRSNAVEPAGLAGPGSAPASGGPVPLPTYAFWRRRFWFDREDDWSDPRPEDGTGDVLQTVVAGVAVVLGYGAAEEVDPDSAFKDLGFDSVSAVELRDRLSAVIGQPLPTTLTYDRPTPRAVARFLSELGGANELGGGPDTPSRPARPADRAVQGDRAVRAGRAVQVRKGGRSGDPIAIVSLSGRWPGADDPDQLWELVRTGRDATGPFPDNRGWDVDGLYDPDGERPGSTSTRRGGFLYDADRFDAEFFGISPREATAMDPQQRLLLESAWELLERAAIVPAALRGSRTAVFVGVTGQEYGPRLHENPLETQGQALTGALTAVASGRLAYTLGLEGPALTVDTACSSSLVAIHLAVQALHAGEADLALAGGAAVMSTPGMFTEFSRQQGLAPDGRCKPFSAGADGTAWAEGVGLVLLERLSDARRNGHPVLALIRGSAVNSSGASNGLSAPNGPSQERVIRAALVAANLSAADVDAVEAHGSGSVLGDPIEAQALIATYGRAARQHPLLIGSIKSNLGSTQAASGVTGVIKMVLALRRGELPGTLHLDQPSPHVDWSAGAVELLTEPTYWPDTGRPRRAAVSSLGIGGTNAHLILQEAPAIHQNDPAPPCDDPAQPPTLPVDEAPERQIPPDHSGDEPLPWVLSARDGEALQAQAHRLLAHLDLVTGNDAAAVDAAAVDLAVAQALAGTRTRFRHRAVVIGADRSARAEGLQALAAGTAPASAATVLIRGGDRARGARRRPGTAFLFPGESSQRPGVGRELSRRLPGFARVLDEITRRFDAEFDRHVPVPGTAARPLRDVMFAEPASPGAALLHLPAYSQPALFAVQVALARFVGTLGLHPDVLLGQGIGELAAAHLAGVLSLTDAVRVVAARGRLMQAVPTAGPTATGNGGEEAFHAARLDPALADFRTVLGEVEFAPPQLPVISPVTGAPADPGVVCDPEHWVRQLWNTVDSHDGVLSLAAGGVRAFLELGSAAVSTFLTDGAPASEGPSRVIVAAPRQGRSELASLTEALARLDVQGLDVDWTAFLGPDTGPALPLPTYPFQRRRYWLSGSGTAEAAAGLDPAGHPLLAAVVDLPDDAGLLFTGRVSLRTQPWLGEHLIGGQVLLPGTALLDLALHVAHRVGADRLEELTLEAPLVLRPGENLRLQVRIESPDGEGRRTLQVHSRPDSPQGAAGISWTRHATGVALPDDGFGTPPFTADGEDTAWPPPGARPVDQEEVYRRLEVRGHHYGPAFRRLTEAWQVGEDLVAEVDLDDSATSTGHTVPPALLDAAVHLVIGARPIGARPTSATGDRAIDRVPLLPSSWAGVRLHRTVPSGLRVRLHRTGPDAVTLAVTDRDGLPVLDVQALTFQPAAEAVATGCGPGHLMSDSAGKRPPDLLRDLAGRSPGDQSRLLLALVRRTAAAVLGHPDSRTVQPDVGFMDAAFNSLGLIELRNQLSTATGLRLTTAALFNYPTPAALADHLRERLVPPPEPVTGEPEPGEPEICGTRTRRESQPEPTRSPVEADDLVERIARAGNDEIFDLLDHELGIS